MRQFVIIITSILVCLSVNAQIYNNFMQAGEYAYKDKNYPLATYFYEEALRQIPADSILDIYITKCLLRDANLYSRKYNDALRYGTDAIQSIEQLGLIGRYQSFEDSLIVANIYSLNGDSVMAARYLDDIFGRTLNAKLTWKGKLQLSNLGGIVSSHLNNWPQAESMYDLSRQIMKKFTPCDETINTLNLYGNALYRNDKYEEALKVYEEQLDVCEKLYGKNSREYHWAQYCIANILAYMGRIDDGASIYKEVIAWYRNKMLNELQSIPATEREKYLENMIELLQNAIPFGIEAKYNEDEFTALAYECLLLTKGLLLSTEKSTETIIRENGTNEEVASITTLYQLKSHLADLLANQKSDPKDVLNTYAQIKTIDVNLANACSQYGNNTFFASIGYEQVKNNLKDGEVLLDFADFKPKSKPRQYVCYEIRREQKYPTVHYICNGAELDSLLTLEKRRWGNLYSGEASADMASIIGSPLRKIIGNSKTVYYVPSGVFHKLAIEAIPFGGKRLGDTCSFYRLSSARELVLDNQSSQSHSAQLYGGLTYGADIKPLSRSLQEVTDISDILNDVMEQHTLVADKGTKVSFMQMNCNAPNIIHLSTHGFYYSPTDSHRPASLQGYNDAMSLSGLVMSGGSLSSRLGLLTADEVAQCNLSKADIACLASCHSGQGEVTAEGIYGLQRAFKKAGVKTVIMNLWEASDVATQCFMTNFYSDLIYGSKDRHQAFEFARNETRKKYSSPFYWAGFVMVD